jgi:transcription elongation factor GreA
MKEKIYLTQQGLQKLKDELDDLINNRRPKVINEIKEARSLGDLSENAGYHSAKEEQSFIESRINEIEDILDRAEVKAEGSKSGADVGSVVTLKIDNAGDDLVYTLVGASEANPGAGLISYESPIGQKIMGAKKGDTFSVESPIGETKYKVIKVD